MRRQHIASVVVAAASISAVGITLAMGPQEPRKAGQQGVKDRYTLTSPSGIAFSEFKGYERWQIVGPSQADEGIGCGTSPDPGCIKATVGNLAMIQAYADGTPFNGKPVPDGAAFAKIEWAKARDTTAGYAMTVPGELAEVSFMVKDAKRFPENDGWGYAKFQYNAGSDTWTAFGDGKEFQSACHACHTLVKASDFVFTRYAKR